MMKNGKFFWGFYFIALVMMVSCAEKKGFIDYESANYISQIKTTGSAQDLVVRDNFVYVSQGEAGLAIIDMEDPTNPVIASEVTETSYSSSGIALNDTTLYLSAGDAGMYFVSIRDPYNPELQVGTFGSGNFGNCKKFSRSGEYLLVANGQDGALKINVLEQRVPIVLGTPHFNGPCYDLIYQNDTTYAACGEIGILALQIRMGEITIPYGSYDTDGYARALQLINDKLIIADGYGGIKIVHITTSNNAIEFEEIAHVDPEGYVTDVAINGDYLAASMRLREHQKFEGVAIYDIGDVANPKLIKKVRTQKANSVDFYNNDYVVCCDDYNGIIVISVD